MLQSLVAENFDHDNRAAQQVEPNRAIGHAAGSRRHVRVLHLLVGDPLVKCVLGLAVVVPALEVALAQELRLLLGIRPQRVDPAEPTGVGSTTSIYRSPESHIAPLSLVVQITTIPPWSRVWTHCSMTV